MWRRIGAGFVAFGVATSPAPAHADGGSPIVSVECPELDPEVAAALKARAQADLLVRQINGILLVSCGDGTTLTFTPADGPSRTAAVPVNAAEKGAVDAVLETLDAILRAPETPALPAEPPTAPPAAPPRPDPVPEPEPGPEAPVRPLPRDDSERPVFLVAAGAFAELWSREIGGALGPRARGVLRMPSGFGLVAGGAALFTPARAAGVSARLVQLFAGGERWFGRDERVEVGVTLGADLLHTSEGGAVPETADHVAFAGDLHGAMVVFPAPLSLSVGLHGVVHPGPVRVQLGETEVFRIPTVTVGVSLDGVLGPF